jgi:TRAP-type mannitol/chloroaromatic compound transport system substrate-binding protein
VFAEIAATNSDFKKVSDHMYAFRNEEYLWWQVAEYGFDSLMIHIRNRT